ncbi:MAG: ATP-binding protein [Pseudomonadota bacterium]
MQLRTRVFLLVAAAALVSGLVAYVAIDRLLVSSYRTLEQSVVRAEIERARNALQNDAAALSRPTSDWANWDDLHHALAGEAAAAEFARINFIPLTFTGLDISRLSVLDRNGRLRMTAGVDAAGNMSEAPPGYEEQLRQLQQALRASGEDHITGVIRTAAGPELVAIQAIHSLADRVNSRGDVVLARALDARFAERLTMVLRRDLAFLPPDIPDGQIDTLWMDFADDRRAWGYFRIDGMDGKPVLIGRIGMPRDIHAQAQDTLGLITLVIAIIVLLAPIGAELIIDRIVVSRVRGLRDWASAVAAGGALAPPVSVGGDDEVGDLATSIGSMATHLDGVQKDLEKAREQADRANRAKSEFLAGASHEIRTPLTAILGYAELLQDRRLGDEEYFRYLGTIRNNGEDLLGILNDVLDLSKIEAGRLDLSWEKSDIRAILCGVVSLLDVKARERGLSLSIEGDTELPLRAFVDPVRFRQILLNLVGNAIRYTDRGAIVVRCRVEHVGPVSARLHVAVQDTGVGMDPVQVARLFRPFTQLGHGSTRRAGGTGLGLALSQEFARAMGGCIRVESVPGKGSVFTLELPLGDLTGVPPAGSEPLPPVTEEAAADEAETFVGANVMLVEDNAVNRLLVEKLLERLQVSVHSETDGMAALDHLLQAGGRYDLVLLDMQLPSLDGYAIARRLRAANYHGIVVALTASAMLGERDRAMQAGCDDFIAKPLQSREFLRTCRSWLRRRRDPA